MMKIYEEAINHLQTIRDFIRWGASRMNTANLYFGHGTDNAIDEAIALATQALYLPPDINTEYFCTLLTPEEKRLLALLIQRRITEKRPLSYLTNRAWFMGLPFYVDERVLIPRSPLAELIEKQFLPWISEDYEISSILDLGTGSGCIGIACAYSFPYAHIDMSDISTDALSVANINIIEHNLEKRTTLINSNLFSNITNCYDVIISNPPYVNKQDFENLPKEYSYEPNIGLLAGVHGLDIVKKILLEAKRYLNREGVLIIEVGNNHYDLCKALPNIPFIWPELERGGEGVFLLNYAQLNDLY